MQISDTTREAWFKIQAENRIVWTSDQPPEQHPLEIIQRAIDAETAQLKADAEELRKECVRLSNQNICDICSRDIKEKSGTCGEGE